MGLARTIPGARPFGASASRSLRSLPAILSNPEPASSPDSHRRPEKQKGTTWKVVPFCFFGVPMGIRTPVTAVKGLCPRPLDDGDGTSLRKHKGRPYGRPLYMSLVELVGIEPTTSCMPCKRSPS